MGELWQDVKALVEKVSHLQKENDDLVDVLESVENIFSREHDKIIGLISSALAGRRRPPKESLAQGQNKEGQPPIMYIVIREDIPTGMAVNSVAHGAMMAEETWGHHFVRYKDWRKNSFRKVTVRATPSEFETLINRNQPPSIGVAGGQFHPHIVVTESALDGDKTVLVFFPKPKIEVEPLLTKLPLYSGAVRYREIEV